MAGNPIPEADARIIEARDMGHCVRCGGMAGEKHHRRRRREHDEHTHQACNVITLCRTCHDWVHANPRQALEVGGWRLKPWARPTESPVLHYLYGWVLLRCDGTFVLAGECQRCGEIKPLGMGLCLTDLRDYAGELYGTPRKRARRELRALIERMEK
jgi:hypothetical protein